MSATGTPHGAGCTTSTDTTMTTLLSQREWIASIDDERDLGNSIIVSLKKGWFFKRDRGCGVQGFDTLAEVKTGTAKSAVYSEEN